jgi:hypothetical protein
MVSILLNWLRCVLSPRMRSLLCVPCEPEKSAHPAAVGWSSLLNYNYKGVSMQDLSFLHLIKQSKAQPCVFVVHQTWQLVEPKAPTREKKNTIEGTTFPIFSLRHLTCYITPSFLMVMGPKNLRFKRKPHQPKMSCKCIWRAKWK